jgi:hypothetical protein
MGLAGSRSLQLATAAHLLRFELLRSTRLMQLGASVGHPGRVRNCGWTSSILYHRHLAFCNQLAAREV